MSGVEGRYELADLPAGATSLSIGAAGYATKTVTGLQIAPGSAVSLDVALAPQTFQLEAIAVSAAAERGSVSRALDQQRTALAVTSAVSREEIQRSPDDNAAEAVRRVSGVTVESDRYVIVRGLGERYTTTQLNGAQLPSPEPDRRVVPLDLFPAGVLEGITVSKTFTPDQEGNFSGAQVNLRTRTFDAEPFTRVSMSVGYNDNVTFRDHLQAPVDGREWLGIASPERAVPVGLRGGDLGSASPPEVAQALAGFRNVWSAKEETALPNLSLSVSRGGATGLVGRDLGYLAAFSYSNRRQARPAEDRALVVRAGQGSETVALNQYTASSGTQSVLWGGVLNFGMDWGSESRIDFNNTYDRTSDSEALRRLGFNEEFATDLDVTRLTFTERSVLSSQLRGQHAWGARRTADWSGTFSRVTRDQPDRSDIVYQRETDPATGATGFVWRGLGNQAATRSFNELSEYSGALQANYALGFGDNGAGSRLKFGGLYRFTSRGADDRSYDLYNRLLTDEQRALVPEEIFGGQFYDAAKLAIGINPSIFGGAYTARENLGAAYAMVEYPLAPLLQLVAGVRVEAAQVDVDALDVGGRSVEGALQ